MTNTADRSLAVERLVKNYTSGKEVVAAVNDVTFSVSDGEFYTLLGPSGCGKTTTLRCVAGLERSDGGKITIAGTVVSSKQPLVYVPSHRRDIGMVFQSYAIWPHMTVFENVAFPLRVAGGRMNAADVKRKVEQALATVLLADYGGRMATQLSGGQQQRLALARALVREPKLLLLDEPLSNLDARLREQLRVELRQLHRRLGVTTLYVTHDQAEALSMSNRIAVMSAGKIVQEGRPREIYQHPATRFVAEFVGATNFIEGKVAAPGSDGEVIIQTSFAPIQAAVDTTLSRGEAVTIAVRPENVELAPAGAGGPNSTQAEVENVIFLGDLVELRLRAGGDLVLARVHPLTTYRRGDTVTARFPAEACSVLHEGGGMSAGSGLSVGHDEHHDTGASPVAAR